MNRESKDQKCNVLLTGGAGFVGQYLLRDLHKSGFEVAVVLRSRSSRCVESRLAELKDQLRQYLDTDVPRLKAIEWDIRLPFDEALSETDLDWIQKHVSTIVHAAASVRFVKDERSNEPFDSNVLGTRRLLELAAYLGDIDFHHVSTAYVCGIPGGLAKETLQMPEAGFRNVYEESKFQAEQLVKSISPQLRSTTIYRPSIVVGDSVTGYAASFHTVYSGLRLATAIPESVAKHGPEILKWIGLRGTEKKNLVPVDWVSRSIVDAIHSPKRRNQIYHLTHPNPVTVSILYESMARAIQQEGLWDNIASESRLEDNAHEVLLPFQRSFQEYFCDDPTFDRTNLETLIPNTPVPAIDGDGLTRMFRFALQHKLREPRAVNTKLDSSCHSEQIESSNLADWEIEEDATKYVFRYESMSPPPGTAQAEVWIRKDAMDHLRNGQLTWSEACRNAFILCFAPQHLQQQAHDVVHAWLHRKLNQSLVPSTNARGTQMMQRRG